MHHTSQQASSHSNWSSLCAYLCKHPRGRVLLHVSTLIRSRKNVRWHLAGIRRDLLSPRKQHED